MVDPVFLGMSEGSGQEPPAKKPARWAFLLRGLLRWTVRLALLLPLLVAGLVGALYIPTVQSWAKDKAVARLSDMTGAPIGLDALHLRFPLRLSLEGLQVPDDNGDTLLNAASVDVDVSLSDLFNKRINLRSVRLAHLRVRLLRDAQGRFNFDHLLAAFASADTTASDTSTGPGWAFTMGTIDVEDMAYDMDLGPEGPDMNVRLGHLHVTVEAFDLDSMRFHLGESRIERAHMVLRTTAGEPEPDTYPDLVNPVEGFDIRSGPLELQDVAFALVDDSNGDSLWMDARHLLAEPGVFDMATQHVPFERIVATDFHFGMLGHTQGAKAEADMKPYHWPGLDDGFRCYLQDWNTEVKELLVTEAGFEMHSDSIAVPKGIMDVDHVKLAEVLLDARNVVACNERLALDLRVLRANTVEGPVNVALNMDLGPQGASVHNALLAFAQQTARLQANASWPDLRTAIERPEGIAFRSVIHGRIATDPLVDLLSRSDISVKGLSRVHAAYTLDAKASGSLLALDTVRMDVRGTDGTELHLTGAVDAPTEIDRLAYDVHLRRFQMGSGAHRFITAWVPPGTMVPRRFAMDLYAKGTVRDVATRIDLRTDLGDAKGTAAVWGLGGDVPDGFRVDLKLADLRLANLLGDTTWGTMGLSVQGAGRDLGSDRRQGWLDVQPDAFVYKGKDISALCLSAAVNGDSVYANVDLNARPLAFMLNGKAMLPNGKDSLKVSVDLALDHIHLKELGVLDHVLRVGGDWHFDAARAPDGALSVRGEMDSTRIWNLEKKVLVEELAWTFETSDSMTAVVVDGDAVQASMRSNMALDTLVLRIGQRFERHFNRTAVPPANPGEHVELDLALPRTDWITDLVVPDLHELELTRCHMRYDGDADHFDADIQVPHVLYDSVDVDTVVCLVMADSGAVNATVDMTRARYGDYTVEGVGLDFTAQGGVADMAVEVATGDSLRNGRSGPLFRFGTQVSRVGPVLEFRLHERAVLAGNAWRSEPDDVLRIGPDRIEATHFAITDGTERIALETTDDVELVLERFHLQNVLGLVHASDSLPIAGGVIDGRVRLPIHGQAIGAHVTITELQVIGVDVGEVTLGAMQPDPEHVSWAATLVRGTDRAEASGDVALAGASAMTARARLNMSDLSWLQDFVEDYLTTLEGGVRGDVTMHWNAGKLGLDGRLDLERMRVGIRQLGQTFTIPGGALVMADGLVSMSDVVILDSLQEAFRITGGIRIADPTEPVLDLGLQAERFHWVHSTYKDNPLFYGDLFAGLDLAIKGRALAPSITGKVRVLTGTDLTVVMPGSKVEMVDGEGVVIFTDDLYRMRNDSVEVIRLALQDSLEAMFGTNEIDLKIDVEKEARFAFLLDPVSGDQATVRGTGDMRFRYGKNRKMDLDGSFTIEEGGYTLDMYGMVRKRFDLVKGGVVSWNGDPMKGAMDFSAAYKSSTAPLALVEDEVVLSEGEKNRYRKPLPFEVYIDLGGTFNDPKVSFRLDLPDIDRKNYARVNTILDKLALKGSEEQLNRQVFGLLVLNSFIPNTAASDEGNLSGEGIASNTARNSVNGLLTQQLNALSGQYLKNVDISVGVNSYQQSQSGTNYKRTSVDYKVSQRLFDDRVTVEVGGSMGVDEHGSSVGPVTNTNTVNYAIGYTLTPDGRYRARAFHEPGYDLYDGEITISGISVQYTKELPGRGKARMRKYGPRAGSGNAAPVKQDEEP